MPDPTDTAAPLPPLAKVPISAPLFVWVGYLLIVGWMGVLAAWGGVGGVFAVIATATFSFQFWTFAVHRGLSRRAL